METFEWIIALLLGAALPWGIASRTLRLSGFLDWSTDIFAKADV